MICPKCGFEVPDGPDCQRCGVVLDKFVKRAHTTATASPGHRLVGRKEKPLPIRRPIGRGIFLLFFLVALAFGGAIGWALVDHHLRSKVIDKALHLALNPTHFGRAMLTADLVHQRIQTEAAAQNVSIPRERTHLVIESENTPAGEYVHVSVKVLLPSKLLRVIHYPTYRHVETRFHTNRLPQGYARYQTDPSSDIAKELAALEK
jgi:hypothetical protein